MKKYCYVFNTQQGKTIVAEIFIRTLKNRIYENMTAVSKTIYFDVLNDIVKNYSNTYHKTIKMKPIFVKSDSYAKYSVDSNEKDPKFKIGDHIKFQSIKTFFLRDMLLIDQEKSLLLRKLKIQLHGHMLLVI